MGNTPPDILLASRISLPENPCIFYVQLKPAPGHSAVDSIEQARRSILSSVLSTTDLLQSVLTSVHISDDPFIYLFRISGKRNTADFPVELFGPLSFEGLLVHESSSFEPPPASLLLPLPQIRQPLAHFYEALRCRVIQDIVNVSVRKPLLVQRHVKRFRNGFMMSQASSSSTSQEYNAITRTLLFCQLQVHFSYSPAGAPSHLVIHPVLQPTPFLDLCHAVPLPSGAPITLLPFGTPAYFLADYHGPTAGLVKQFHASLLGFGAGDWAASPGLVPSFVIAWIKVENKQGEDKGLTVIYPTRLCLTCLPLSSRRSSLEYIPELPTPLQPSPQVPHADFLGQEPKRPSSTPIQPSFSRPVLVSSPTSESISAFRALTLSSKDLRCVSNEVGGYVDTVARERERERERLKREREHGAVSSSPKASRASVTTPAAQPIDPPTPTATLSAFQPPVQSFYPSPPQTTPNIVEVVDVKTSPSIINETLPDIQTLNTSTNLPHGTTAPPTDSTPSQIPYNSYSLNSAWTQASSDYLGMDLDNMDFGVDNMGLNFDMDVGSLENPHVPPSVISFDASRTGVGTNAGMEFEDAFTDDDFSFFDRPSRVPQISAAQAQSITIPEPLSSHFLQSSTSGVSAPLTSFWDLTVGQHQPPSTSQMWTPHAFPEGLTPRSMVDHTDTAPPELLPSSQGHTPDSHSAPPTPDAHLGFAAEINLPSLANNAASARLFEPIPFARHHTNVDGKYAAGKFSLPSPPPEEDWTNKNSTSLPASPSAFVVHNGWRLRYDSATDPKLSLYKKLIGVKRKTPPTKGLQRPPNKRALWSPISANCDKSELEDETVPTVESESEHEDDYFENESLPASRPVTPPPSYLPLGPTLIPTYFNHKDLLPLSVPLRPPGAAISPLNLTNHSNNPPPSFPTPVSPAAHLGAATERSRSLEAAAFAIASEVIENPLWAETWQTNVTGPKHSGEIWPTDVKLVQRLLEQLPVWQGVTDMLAMFGSADDSASTITNDSNQGHGQSQSLDPPVLSIGKGEAVIQILPPALRFWEKLGLSPKNGHKDVTVFALFEDDGFKQPLVQNWLDNLVTVYQGKHYGSMTLGISGMDSPDGIVALRFDTTFRKSLNSLVQCLPDRKTINVVFLILPVALMALSSPIFRQILTLTRKATQNQGHSSQLLFQFIPEHHIYSGTGKTAQHDSPVDLLSTSVYNKIHLPVDRLQLRSLSEYDHHKDDIRSLFAAPSFTLSRPTYSKVTLVRAAKASLDVIDRHTLLHVAYHLTSCGKWIIACCVDQRGESHQIGVWLTQPPADHESDSGQTDELYAVKKVWNFAMQFARQTDVEWRVVFARLGVPTEGELDAWTNHLSHEVSSYRDQPPLHQTLICVVPDAPWYFVPLKETSVPSPRPLASRNSGSKHTSLFADTSSTTFAVFARNRLPIPIPPSPTDLCIGHTLIAEPAGAVFSPASPNCQEANAATLQPSQSHASLLPHALSILPQLTSVLVHRSFDHSTKTRTAAMSQIHLLRTYHSTSYTHSAQSQPGSTSAVPSDEQLISDITRNFYELAVLSKLRWQLHRLGGHPGLPFHLAATDAIRTALDMDWDRLDSFSVDL